MAHPPSSGAGGCLSGIHLGRSNEEGDPVRSHPGRSTGRGGEEVGEKQEKGDREERYGGGQRDVGSSTFNVQGLAGRHTSVGCLRTVKLAWLPLPHRLRTVTRSECT